MNTGSRRPRTSAHSAGGQIWPAEGKFVNYEFVYDGTELAVAEMIKSGTTCFIDQYFFAEAAADVVMKTGIRACLGVPLLGARGARKASSCSGRIAHAWHVTCSVDDAGQISRRRTRRTLMAT